MSGRSEAFLSDNQGRDIYTEAELALDEKGKFLALRIRNTGNMGAYIGAVGANIPTFNFTRCLPGMYDIKRIDVATRCVFTNTMPTAPYRGAGRPEANYVLERLVDEAARISGIDPVKLRRRNLIKKSQMPYKTAIGTTIDSGDFEPILDKALELADYDDFKQRKREAAKRGKYRGLGLSCMLEHAGGAPVESAQLSFPGGDKLLLTLNVQNTGQGHATVFPRVIAERLGIPFASIAHTNGNSAHELAGYASVGSRSAMTVGPFDRDSDRDHRRRRASRSPPTMLETGEADIAYKNGSFEVVGTDRRVSLFEVAARAAEMKKRGEIAEDLDTKIKDRNAAVVSERLPHRRGRDRSRHRPSHDRRLCRGRRLRPAAQPHDRRRPAARLAGAGARPGADGEHDLRHGTPASSSPARSWTTRCRAPRTCRRCATPCTTCRRRPIRSASKASAKPAPPPPSPR